MLEPHERDLTDAERRYLQSELGQLRADRRSTLPKTGAAALAVCGPLAVLTALASDSPTPTIVGFWMLFGLGLAVWIASGGKRAIDSKIRLIGEVLQAGRARSLRVTSTRMVEFEEIEDEGACFAFQVDPQRILLLHGQQYYPDGGFPSTDFEIVEFRTSGGQTVGEQIVNRGPRLAPERVIDAATKDSLLDWRASADAKTRRSWPDDRSILEGDVSRIEEIIRAHIASGSS